MGNFDTNYNSSKHTRIMKYAHNTLCSAFALSVEQFTSFPLNKYHAFFLSNYSSLLCSYTVNVETDKGWGGDSGQNMLNQPQAYRDTFFKCRLLSGNIGGQLKVMNHKYTLRNLQQHAYTLSSFMGVYLRTYPASCTLESCVGGGDDP